MPQILIVLIGICSWVGYIMHNGHVDEPKITEKERIVYNQVKPKQQYVPSSSGRESAAYLAAQKAFDEESAKDDKNVEHYDQATLDGIKSMMNKDTGTDSTSPTTSTSSTQDTLNSGDATYSGSSDDSSVGSVQTETGTTVKVAAGYHWVKGYTTKKGKVVKGHVARNAHTKKKTTTTKNLSTKTFTRAHDIAQRSTISKQNFPGATISGSDPTIIIGIH
jgi:hypothetical protein